MDEQVERIDFQSKWDIGAPSPHLLQSELHTFLVYFTNDDKIAVIEWKNCQGAVLGAPSDETIEGHRLWHKGLEEAGTYSASIVKNSKWIEDLKKVDAVHPRHNPLRFDQSQHFILSLHDSTFECIASGYTSEVSDKPLETVLQEVAQRIRTV